MQFMPLSLADVVEIHPHRHVDARGYFAEIFRQSAFDAHCGPAAFVQENESLSAEAGTIRGLHFQTDPAAQGKLVRCLSGAIFDVAVDLRQDSPDYGKWVGVTLSAEAGNQLWIPEGFAHGFCTLVADTRVTYKVTSYYAPANDKGVAWNDPEIGIVWPAVADPATLSAKDRVQPALAELPPLFRMAQG